MVMETHHTIKDYDRLASDSDCQFDKRVQNSACCSETGKKNPLFTNCLKTLETICLLFLNEPECFLSVCSRLRVSKILILCYLYVS